MGLAFQLEWLRTFGTTEIHDLRTRPCRFEPLGMAGRTVEVLADPSLRYRPCGLRWAWVQGGQRGVHGETHEREWTRMDLCLATRPRHHCVDCCVTGTDLTPCSRSSPKRQPPEPNHGPIHADYLLRSWRSKPSFRPGSLLVASIQLFCEAHQPFPG